MYHSGSVHVKTLKVITFHSKSGKAASCGATVMMVFNKDVSHKILSKSDNE